MINVGLDDEVFVVRDLELVISIAELIASINDGVHELQLFEVETEKLFELVTSDEIDSEHIKSMSEERKDQPILLSYLCGVERIIDGNHRLHRRKLERLSMSNVINVSPDILVHYSRQLIESSSRRHREKWKKQVFGL